MQIVLEAIQRNYRIDSPDLHAQKVVRCNNNNTSSVEKHTRIYLCAYWPITVCYVVTNVGVNNTSVIVGHIRRAGSEMSRTRDVQQVTTIVQDNITVKNCRSNLLQILLYVKHDHEFENYIRVLVWLFDRSLSARIDELKSIQNDRFLA